MLHLNTSAPAFVVREIMALGAGFAEDPDPASPAWVEQVLHVKDETAFAVIHALREYRIEARRPARVAIGDPTFAMAAAAIERGGSSSAPAAAFVR